MTEASPCTCSQPATVHLSSKDCRQSLLNNLGRYGWSPIIVDNLSSPPPSHEEISAFFHGTHDFQKSCMTYRSAESGAKGKSAVEPKESLEVQLKASSGTTTTATTAKPANENGPTAVIQSWCQQLSQIAHRVCEAVLRIPPNTLLSDNPEESLDLMRVFHYHATEKQEMGSSEHTDWGSWTIVWQDSVGGLETFCRPHQKWVGVEPPAAKEGGEEWYCVVHVGDMASLALGLPSSSLSGTVGNSTSSAIRPMIRWPSPKHRVVTSRRERTSLVYFGYPPAQSSIHGIQKALENWNVPSRGKCLPLPEYYLLHDQSSSSPIVGEETNFEALLPDDIYSSIAELSVQEVIQKKWKQVQRTSY